MHEPFTSVIGPSSGISASTIPHDIFNTGVNSKPDKKRSDIGKLLGSLYALREGMPIPPNSRLRKQHVEFIDRDIIDICVNLIAEIDDDITAAKLSGESVSIDDYETSICRLEKLIDIYINGMDKFKI